jgi:hypothetical protein
MLHPIEWASATGCIEGEAQSPRAPEELALQTFTEATRGGKCPVLASALQATIATEEDVS